jgi:hypothetical protein
MGGYTQRFKGGGLNPGATPHPASYFCLIPSFSSHRGLSFSIRLATR